jgi:predicted RNA-binding Zn ribbon-like protein
MTASDQVDAQLLVDLINTHYLVDQSDVLAEVGATKWLREHLGYTSRKATAAALAPLRLEREGLRQMAIANNGGQADAAVVAQADAALRRAPITVTLAGRDRDPVAHSTAPDGSIEQVMGTVAIAYLSSHIGGIWPRVKACAEPGCRWAFLDLSRNSSRRWWEMSECGNRAKNRAWRTRQGGRAV